MFVNVFFCVFCSWVLGFFVRTLCMPTHSHTVKNAILKQCLSFSLCKSLGFGSSGLTRIGPMDLKLSCCYRLSRLMVMNNRKAFGVSGLLLGVRYAKNDFRYNFWLFPSVAQRVTGYNSAQSQIVEPKKTTKNNNNTQMIRVSDTHSAHCQIKSDTFT